MQSTNASYFVFSDVDVVQLQPIRSDLEELLEPHDGVFQQELSLRGGRHRGCTVNSGFYAMKVNDATIRFMQAVIRDCNDAVKDSIFGDMCAINAHLPMLQYGILPSCYRSRAMDIYEQRADYAGSKIYHATFTGNPSSKLLFLKQLLRECSPANIPVDEK